MPNIAVITHTLTRTDGQGRVNTEALLSAAKQCWPVDALSSDLAMELRSSPDIRFHRIAVPSWVPSALLKYQWFAWAARRKFMRLPKPDVLQLNGAIVHGIPGGVNVANFVHGDWMRSPLHPARGRWSLNGIYQGMYTWLNAAWEKRAFARAERVVAVSEQVQDALVRWAGVSSEKIEVIEPGVDSEQFRPMTRDETNSLRTELSVTDDALVLMFVGDIRSNRKNLDLVLNAVAQLPERVRLAVVGDAARSLYPAMAERLGIGGRVHFLGRRTTDLPALMRGADAFVFPSHYDPFALVVTEAMASGLPVVTAPTVGASALIRDGENGFVLPSAIDLAALVRVIEQLLADPERRKAIGRAARRTAEQYSWADMAAKYLALYQKVIASRTGSGSVGATAG